MKERKKEGMETRGDIGINNFEIQCDYILGPEAAHVKISR